MADNIEVLGVLKLQPDQRSIDEMAAAIQAKLSNVTAGGTPIGSAASGGSGSSGSQSATPAPETKPVASTATPKEGNVGKAAGEAIKSAFSQSRFGQIVDRLRLASDGIAKIGARAGSAAQAATTGVGVGRGVAGLAGGAIGGAALALATVIIAAKKSANSNVEKLVRDADVSPYGARIALLREINRRENAAVRSSIAGQSGLEYEASRLELNKTVNQISAHVANNFGTPIMKNLYDILNDLLKYFKGGTGGQVDINKSYRQFFNRAVLAGYSNAPPPIPGMVMQRPVERSNMGQP